jgi:hypothetical protein
MEAFQFDLDSISSPKFCRNVQREKALGLHRRLDAEGIGKGRLFHALAALRLSLEANSKLTPK